ncbi:MAG: malate:quinone oxidoreductase, partial [Leucobacter sp.]|nr:malate:quinone oxidoreductase [Leucobacter sp.]
GLLGASPGASTAVHAMLGVLKTCFPDEYSSKWEKVFKEQVPALGEGLNGRPDAAKASLERTTRVLDLALDAPAPAEAAAVEA